MVAGGACGMILGRAEAMGSDGENRLRHERLWNRMSVASRGTLNAVDKNVLSFWPFVFMNAGFFEVFRMVCIRGAW